MFNMITKCSPCGERMTTVSADRCAFSGVTSNSKHLNSTMFDAMFFTFMRKKGLSTTKTNATSAALKGCGNVGLPRTSSAMKCQKCKQFPGTMQFHPMKNIILRQPLPLVLMYTQEA